MTYLEYLQKLGSEKPDKLARLFAVEVDANGILTAENVVTVEPDNSNDAYELRVGKLMAQRDEYKLLAEAYKTERDVLRDENLKMALTIAAIREQLEDDGR